METSAVSPWCRYSKPVEARGLIQPVPVAVKITRYSRSKAPVRSSSATASRARSGMESAESMPT